MASTNFSGVECTSSGVTNDSVEPHQQVTRRETRDVFRKFAMSSLLCSASSHLFLPFLMLGPSSTLPKAGQTGALLGWTLKGKASPFPGPADSAHLHSLR